MSATSFERCRLAFKAMGCPCELLLDVADPNHGRRVLDLLAAEISRLEHKYSRYLPDSLVSRINASAGKAAGVTVDAETAGLLDYAATCHQQSGGLFDITSGSLRRVWHFARTAPAAAPPDTATLHAVLATVGWSRLHWQTPLLVLPVAGMEIDFGGIVKEYAVDRCVALALAEGIAHGLVNLGGDIGCIGPPADAEGWTIGISRPEQPDLPLATVCLRQGALATSGDYQRFVDIDGKRYGHILNPLTGWPTSGLASASVLAEHCVVAGAAATIALLKEDTGEDWLDQLGLAWLGIRQDGTVRGSITAPLAPGIKQAGQPSAREELAKPA